MAGNPCNIIPDQEIVLEGGAKLVPAPGAADAGKVLGVINQEGGIGWVEDQSGTLVQQQANWAETDNQSVSFIQNKPDLSVYATTSAMNTALGGKQDVINDLNDIRAGAALGATAAQPSDLPSSDELVPSATSGDSGKVLTVDNQGTPSWVTPATVTVDQTYNASSTNPQSGTAVAEALGSSSTLAAGNGVSLTESSGTLTVAADVDNVTIGFDSTTHKIKSLQTVGQTYDAASSNAQSGTAVAQAIASIPSSSYTAGDAIDITNNEISVDYDTNTLDTVGQPVTENVTQKSSSGLFLLPSSVAALLSQQDNTQVTVHIPANTLKDETFYIEEVGEVTYRLTLYATDSTSESSVSLFSTPIEYTLDVDQAVLTEQDIVFNLPASVANQWSQNLSSAVAFNICGQKYSAPATSATLTVIGNLSTNPITFTFVDASVTKLAVKNPLPASTSADENKVLTVDNNGDPAWATPDEGIDVVTASGNFKIGGSVPVKVNYTAGSSEYERGPLQQVNTLDAGGNYAVAMFKVVGSQNIYSGTFGSATLTINEAMDIVGTGNSDLTIAFSDSASEWSTSRFLYRDSFTRTDGKIVAQSLNIWNATPYDTGSYIGVGIKVANGPGAEEQVAAVLQQLANGAVSISNWPVEQFMVTNITNIPAFTSADAGRVLQVQNDGTLAWVTLS